MRRCLFCAVAQETQHVNFSPEDFMTKGTPRPPIGAVAKVFHWFSIFSIIFALLSAVFWGIAACDNALSDVTAQMGANQSVIITSDYLGKFRRDLQTKVS
jgi:hypothetical protein